MPHAQSGEVAPECYQTLLEALKTGRPETFDTLARGSGMRLVSPQAAFGLSLEGADAETFFLPPPPSVTSGDAAAEMVELYWQALARDVKFAEYETSSVIREASVELDRLAGFAGPRPGGRVTASTIFRGDNPGSLTGVFLSQFLLKPVPLGSTMQEQRYRAPATRNDFMETYPEWLQIQSGVPPWREYRWDQQPRYILNGRDLSEFIHYDFLYQAFLNAALILMNSGPGSIYNTNYYFSETNPYKHSKTVMGFVTLGFGQVVDWLGRVTTPALKAAWFQKWLVHRYLRPEEFGGLVHRTKTGMARYPLHADVMESRAVDEIHRQFGSFLLPQAYPEGCPLHPAYPSGHATVAGACATILKALFDEAIAVPDCVVPTHDGQSLVPYRGPALTVKGEIEKLAFNVAMGRNFAGIHWRSDAVGGIQLGEEVAITILEDLVNTFAEDFSGFRFTRFDGRPVHISKMA
jgi:membrane-associated phospholipid phosphatase